MTSALRTRAVHAGRDDLTDLGVHAAPLDLSTTYPSRDSAAEGHRIDEFAGEGVNGRQPRVYYPGIRE